ncbi:MAG: hypothetical protein IPO93_04135 [Actinobacteria bacterium]|jgi:hypothetical protein|nr:hypothetical protein [Actinomycetota bacterium]
MTAGIDHSTAALIAQDALRAVFDAQAVAALREDSPLSALGIADSDVVCIADAVAVGAVARGRECRLGDADLDGVTTVADLVRTISEHGSRPGVS